MRGFPNSVGIVVLGVVVLLIFCQTIYLMISSKATHNLAEPYANYNNNLPISQHKDYVKRRGFETNLAMALINQMLPIVQPSPQLQKSSIQALNSVEVKSKGRPGEFQLNTDPDPLQFNPKDVDLAAKARFCQEYATTANCDFWNPPSQYHQESTQNYMERYRRWQQFTRDCGLSLDINGTNFQGKNHQGGLYVGEENKNKQLEYAADKPNKEKYYKPTIGTSRKGLFSLNKESCKVIEEKLKCGTQKNFDVPNCSQCFIQDSWLRIDGDSQRLNPELFLGGSGEMQILSQGKRTTATLTKEVQKAEIPALALERTDLRITVTADNPMIYGFLASATRRIDPFRFELLPLVEVDQQSGMRPASRGFVVQNDIRMNRIVPAVGHAQMMLLVKIPFTFLNVEDDASVECNNSPFITKSSSASLLSSNPCFGPGARPGSYSRECLKDKFMAVGGRQEGTGFPRDAASVNKLNVDSRGRPRDIADIGEYLYEMSVRASTGRAGNGMRLSLDEWNEASMFILGKPIRSPCDGQENMSGANLSDECLQFLYRNQGQGGDFGATYTADFTLSSLLGKSKSEKGSTYCQPSAPLDPNTPSGKEAIRNLPNLTAVRQLYNTTHAKANNNNISIADRSKEIKQCYNVDIAQPPQAEVYWAGPNYNYTIQEAREVARNLGGVLAKYQQVVAAFHLGAHWCVKGWVDEGQVVVPSGDPVDRCSDTPKVMVTTPENGKSGIHIFGIKPAEDSDDTIKYGIKPFNTNNGQWNSKEVFGVYEIGYDKTKSQAAEVCADLGATPATLEQLQKTWNAGGQWCMAGWVSDTSVPDGKYPMQVYNGLCGTHVGIVTYEQSYAPKSSNGKPMFAVNCYGVRTNNSIGSTPKPKRNVVYFFNDTKDINRAKELSSYDYYKKYRPVPLEKVGLVHPYYFRALDSSPKKVQILSAKIPGGLWYTTEQKLGLFEMVPSIEERFTFTIGPRNDRPGDWEKCSAVGVTKVPAGDGTQDKNTCESQGNCYNNQTEGPACYRPYMGIAGVYIKANTGLRIACSPDGMVTVDRPHDGPWEFWYIEPVPNKPQYVAFRSYFGKYLSATRMFSWFNATANTIGEFEQFAIISKD